MGANVGFIAFRDPPDVDWLGAVPGLTGYRLFKHASKPEWFIEGPNPEGDAITFYEPLDYAPPAEAIAQARNVVAMLVQAIESSGSPAANIDKDGLAQALVLSTALGAALLFVYGNDEDWDGGFVCEDGAIVSGRLAGGPHGIIAIDNGAIALVAPEPSGFHEDGEPYFAMYNAASSMAAAFFGTPSPWPISSDPYDFDAGDYGLLASRGSRAPFRLPGADTEDTLRLIANSDRAESEKLSAFLALAELHLIIALDQRLISAARSEVDYAEAQISVCYLGTRWRAGYEEFFAYLETVLTYLRRLRPRPEFRHDIDFAAEAQRLMNEWRRLKAKHQR